MSSHSQPRSCPSAPSAPPHLAVWAAVLQAVLLCLVLVCWGFAMLLGYTWLQQGPGRNVNVMAQPLFTAPVDLLTWAGLCFTAAVVLLGTVLWWRAQLRSCAGRAQVVDVQLEPSALSTTSPETPCFTPPAEVAWAGWQTLQPELLRSLPGPAMLVQRTAQGWHLLDRNEDARATLPAKPTPALDRIIADLIDQAEPTSVSDTASLAQTGRTLNVAMRLLELPSGCCILWRPPAPPETVAAPATVSPAAPLSPPPNPITPSTATDEDRAALVYTVSHDLRAPIRVIEGFTRILIEDYGHALDRVGNDHLERVLGAASRMNSMIDALLDLSRLSTQELKQERVDLSAVATQVQLELQQQAPQRQVQWLISPGLWAQGDPTLLHSVMENLLGNAWKYSARREQARIEFGQTEYKGQSVFFVRDNGAGFDMRFAGKLFGAFQRLHGATEFAGTGIGLASVRRIVRRHGGDIWAEGVVNEGATFYFTLHQTPGSANCSTA